MFSIVLIRAKSLSSADPAASLLGSYIDRASKYAPAQLERFPSEARFSESLKRQSGRTRPVLILADSTGVQVTSTGLADIIRTHRDAGRQQVMFAIGPADGWSKQMLQSADAVIAFGRITLPHELAAVVLAEQVYRALTILAGHPYHSGH